MKYSDEQRVQKILEYSQKRLIISTQMKLQKTNLWPSIHFNGLSQLRGDLFWYMRGFDTKREALDWERECPWLHIINSTNADTESIHLDILIYS